MVCVTSWSVLLIIVCYFTVGIAQEPSLTDGTPEVEVQPIIVGDIRFHPDTFEKNNFQRSGIIGRNSRWANGVVLYELDSGFGPRERLIIQQAMDNISNKTCVRFKIRTTEPDWIFLRRDTNGGGCWSWLTKIGGKQILNLQTPGCIFQSTISHELIHAIGFAHEQSRPDRDSFVDIHWKNILEGKEGNFVKFGSNVVTTYGIPYDLTSIMHYGQYYFSKDRTRLPTITSKVAGKTVSQGNELSAFDSQKINAMYRGICTSSVASSSTPESFKNKPRRRSHGK